ncbi:MAG: glycerol-3-phosphate acyltransferase [Lachnospiraceae bacterium]|nr:glycerol-3-phosphate acyltransferase [Lachnospiraceae bacterium]
MVRLWCLLIGYAFGLFQTAFFYGKLNGIDIRTAGSGNAGTTNALRVLGPKAGLIVMIGDIAKTMIAIAIVKCSFGDLYPDIKYLLVLYTAMGAILGHNYPFYMGFKGGKGIACTGGLVFSSHWSFIVVGVLAFFIPFFTIHIVSVGSLLVYLLYVIQLIIMGQMGFFAPMSQANLIEMYAVAIFLMLMAYWRHRTNIVNLIHGKERKTYLVKKPEGYVNPSHSGREEEESTKQTDTENI